MAKYRNIVCHFLLRDGIMKHGVTKGDMCKAVRGNLLSSYISILLCQQKGDITEKQFLTDLAIGSSPMYSLAKDMVQYNIKKY